MTRNWQDSHQKGQGFSPQIISQLSGMEVDLATALAGGGGGGGGGGGSYPTTGLNVFVDYTNGSDANTGLNPAAAFKTISAAYSALKTVAIATYTPYTGDNSIVCVGRINLMAGRHDIGTGLAIDYRYPVEVVGQSSGGAYFGLAGSSVVYSSSASVAAFIVAGDSTHTTYGNRFVDITFEVNPSVNTTIVNNANFGCFIRAWANDYLRVYNCSTRVSNNTNVDVPLLIQQSDVNSDNAWLRLVGCSCRNTPLYWARAAPTGTNFNRSVIAWNIVEFGSGASYPMIWLEGDFWQGLVEGNNCEGSASGPAITLGSVSHGADSNTFVENGGEAGTNTYPYYDVVHGSHNIFIGGTTTANNGTNGTWIAYGTNSYPNICINPQIDYVGATGYKHKIVDSSTWPTMNQLYNKWGRMYPAKSGAGATYSTSDYPSLPPNGQISGIAYDSNLGKSAVFFTANGVFSRVTEDLPPLLTQRKFVELGAETATTAFAPGSTIQAGKLAVLAVTSSGNKTVSSVADSAGNTWTVDATEADGSRGISFCSSQIATQVTTGGTVTITWSSSTSATVTLWVQEVANAAASSAFDKTANGTGTGTALATSSTASLAQANEVVFGCFRTTSGAGGWTHGATYVDPGSPASVSPPGSMLEYKIVGSTAAVLADGTYGASGTWCGLLATYKGL